MISRIRGKIISLQAAADSQNSHIVAITETKGTPPALEGYAPWYHRPRNEGDGGGVAITVRNDIKQNSQLIDYLETNNNQEIIRIQINLNRRNKIYAGVYYGKQENTPAGEVEREMSQLRAQITKLRPKGLIILTETSTQKSTKTRKKQNKVPVETASNLRKPWKTYNWQPYQPSQKLAHGQESHGTKRKLNQ